MTDQEPRTSAPEGQVSDWLAGALARRAGFEADRAAFTAAVKRNADTIAAQIGALLPDGPTLGYEDWAGLLAQLPRLKRHELHCHADVIEALKRIAAAPPEKTTFFGHNLAGIDVIITPDLGPGGWELHEDGQMINSGRLTQ